LGLHSGEKVKINIKPAPSAIRGYVFEDRSVPNSACIDARFDNVFDTTLATSIGSNGCRVSTIEHLMAAFYGLGIDNARVELDGPEVPIMDGSSAPFVYLLKSVGIEEQSEAETVYRGQKNL
jgi:UDP-3-O-[3-hydroxymyristoyl] N-acetylglucosamine deacetylase